MTVKKALANLCVPCALDCMSLLLHSGFKISLLGKMHKITRLCSTVVVVAGTNTMPSPPPFFQSLRLLQSCLEGTGMTKNIERGWGGLRECAKR